MNKKEKRSENAITLVALVITIIILLILAGITISQLANNGLFDRSKTAKEESENAIDKEETELAKYENEINSYFGGNRENEELNYSTEERKIGTWIDNKNLYQKTLNLQATDWSRKNKKYIIDLSTKIPNVKEVIESDGFIKVNYNSTILTYGFGTIDTSSTGEASIISNYSQGNICVVDLLGITMANDSIITFKYTKTTD